MNSQKKMTRGNYNKLFIIILLLLIDLSFNSSLDYDNYNNTLSSKILFAFVVVQIVVQVVIFLVLFLIMADTFLFRVGLLGLLLKKFRLSLVIHPVYMLLTIGCGIYRVGHLSSHYELNSLWKNNNFKTLSDIQKIGIEITVYVDCVYRIIISMCFINI